MANTTWDESPIAPQYAIGLPSEIHFWKSTRDENIYILRWEKNDETPTWFCWNEGVAIKNVGLDG